PGIGESADWWSAISCSGSATVGKGTTWGNGQVSSACSGCQRLPFLPVSPNQRLHIRKNPHNRNNLPRPNVRYSPIAPVSLSGSLRWACVYRTRSLWGSFAIKAPIDWVHCGWDADAGVSGAVGIDIRTDGGDP